MFNFWYNKRKGDLIMENKKVDFIVYEANEARHERTVKRLIIALVISAILMFASNALWLWAWTSYDYSSEQTSYVDVDGKDGNANYIGNNGDINNGLSKSDDDQADTSENEENR